MILNTTCVFLEKVIYGNIKKEIMIFFINSEQKLKICEEKNNVLFLAIYRIVLRSCYEVCLIVFLHIYHSISRNHIRVVNKS